MGLTQEVGIKGEKEEGGRRKGEVMGKEERDGKGKKKKKERKRKKKGKEKKKLKRQVWWCTPLIPALGRQTLAELSLRAAGTIDPLLGQSGLGSKGQKAGEDIIE